MKVKLILVTLALILIVLNKNEYSFFSPRDSIEKNSRVKLHSKYFHRKVLLIIQKFSR